jgi:hypothetical protein
MEVVGFIRSGKEENLLPVRELDVGEERGWEAAFSEFESGEEGINGILFWLSDYFDKEEK